MLTRREMLHRSGAGFGMLGLAGMLHSAELNRSATTQSPATAVRGQHFPARAKRVIFLFMNGAPSHVDTFDPKPALKDHEGTQPSGDQYRKNKGTGFMPSPFAFQPHGQSGVVMSEL